MRNVPFNSFTQQRSPCTVVQSDQYSLGTFFIAKDPRFLQVDNKTVHKQAFESFAECSL